jgi:DNA-binding response OmpR family regulator
MERHDAMGVRVLLIEDDDTIAEPLTEGLRVYGLTVRHVGTGTAGLHGPYDDVVLLDLGLPDMDGIDVCRGIRRTSDVPVIILSARGEEADRVLGLELGADDYLAKPFSVRELVARIRAVHRRRQPPREAPYEGERETPYEGDDERTGPGPLVVDRRTRQVWVGGEQVALTPKEFELLALLAEDAGAVYSRQEILGRVWDEHYDGPTKTLDVHVATLRRKLGDPAWIQTLRGVGFRLAVQSPEQGWAGAQDVGAAGSTGPEGTSGVIGLGAAGSTDPQRPSRARNLGTAGSTGPERPSGPHGLGAPGSTDPERPSRPHDLGTAGSTGPERPSGPHGIGAPGSTDPERPSRPHDLRTAGSTDPARPSRARGLGAAGRTAAEGPS